MDNSAKKKFIGIVVAIVVALFLVQQGYRWLMSGRLVVSTNVATSTITLAPSYNYNGGGSASNGKVLTLKSGKGVSLKGGTYVVTVSASNASITQVVRVSLRHTSHYTLTPTSPTPTELVTNVNAQSVVGTSSELQYVDRKDGHLYAIDAASNLSRLDATANLQQIHWADSTFGVGQDNNGHLYTIENGTVSPFNPIDGTIGSFDVAPNHHIYIQQGAAVYGGTVQAGLKKIFDASGAGNLVASNNGVAIIVSQGQVIRDQKAENITVVMTDGSHTTKSLGAYTGAWSPSGKYFTITDDAGSDILDSSLSIVATVPQNNFNSPVWLDDNTLLYGVSNQLWEYNVATQASHLAANAPTGHSIQGISINGDKSYVYLALTNSGGAADYQLARVGLHGQPVAAISQQLVSQLPLVSSQCISTLINFTKLALVERPVTGGNSSQCPAIDKAMLRGAGIDTTPLTFVPSNLSADL